ncbi:MAG: hypothetical protein ACRDT2_10415 [Natronosporangium sp.]
MKHDDGWLRAVGRFLRPRRRQASWATGLGVGGVGMLVGALPATGLGREVLVNLGASFVMVALSFVVFDPIFENMRKNSVEEHRTLNMDQLVLQFSAARTRVEIMETWTGLLEESHRERFLAAAEAGVQRGVQVRILLLDPDSAAAEQRAEELDHTQVQVLIMENLQYLYQLRRGLEPAAARRFQVRVYDASPSIQLYRWDEKAYISFFPVGVRAYDARQIEAFMASPLGEFVEGRFDELWASNTTRPMDDFMTIGLTVRRGGADLGTSQAHFVRLGTAWYIDRTAISDHVTLHGILQLTIHTRQPLIVDGTAGTVFGVEQVAVGQKDLVAMFDAKYGPGHRATQLFRLAPRT